MTNRFMISVAAVTLIAGSGFANAQGTGSREVPSAPSERPGSAETPANREATKPMAPSSGMKATQSDQKQPEAGKNQRAEEKGNMQDQKSKSSNSEMNNNAKGSKESGKDMKAEGRDSNTNADSKGAADSKSQTVGQAGSAGKLSGEQRTRITTVIRNEHVAPVTNVNFSISVGTRVPRDVGFHPLPAEIVTIYPDWRGYEFIMVRDQIVVIDPRTLEIVAVLEA
jgi:hypothetical protein